MSETIFQDYSAFYDLLYSDKSYAAEAKYVADVLRSACPHARSLLELGSGTGRHGRLLAEEGYDVFGVEGSDSMVSVARRGLNGTTGQGSFECVRGDVRTARVDRKFDAVLALFHVVSYQTSNSDILQTFATAASHLAPGGLFFFDVWHGPAVLRERPSVRVKRVENDCIRLTRIAEPEMDTDASVVTVRYTVLAESKSDKELTTFKEEHRMRYYFPVEIDLIAQQAGFDVEHSEEFLSGQPMGEATWGVGYLLRKRS